MANISQYKPAPGYILIREQKPKALGGINLSTEDWEQFGKVIKVGDPSYIGNTSKPQKPPCKKGDDVIVSSGGFEHVRIDGVQYKVVRFDRVLLIKK